MQMEVLTNAGSGAVPEIHADVETFGAVALLEPVDARLEEARDLRVLARGQAQEVGRVAKGNHHEVAAVVREAVQDDEGELSHVKDQVLLQVLAIGVANKKSLERELLLADVLAKGAAADPMAVAGKVVGDVRWPRG